MNKVRWIIQPQVYIVFALSVLVLPIQWVAAWMSAMLIHELSHYITMRLCKVQVYAVQIGLMGTRLQSQPMSELQELICAAAGPFIGIAPVMMIRVFPRLAICAMALSAFNLLPVFPMDGGRILRVVSVYILGDKWGNRITHWIGFTTTIMLMIAFLYGGICMKLGYAPMIAMILLTGRCIRSKFACKQQDKRVQYY